MSEPTALPRLYAILDLDASAARGIDSLTLLRLWLDAGVQLVQLRAKAATLGQMLTIADAVVQASRPYGATIIVNDRADVAALSEARGLHVGQSDLEPEAARRMIGDHAWLGLSTHNDGQLDAALDEPISYVAMGPVYGTASKDAPDATVGLDGVRRAANLIRRRGRPVPLVAIGGITLAAAPGVLAAGADAVAVISGLLSDDPAATAAEWVRALR